MTKKKLKTICYGMEDEWNSRKEAIDYFTECSVCSEGSEKLRYVTIIEKIIAGYDVCDDDDQNWQ